MVILNTKLNNVTHLGGGDLSNHTIALRKNKHERILENPSL